MIKKIAYFGAGNAGTAGLNFLLTIFFSKNLNEHDFSNFVLYQTLINFLFCIIGYNLAAGVLKKSINDFELTRYVNSAVVVGIFVSMLLIILSALFGTLGARYFPNAIFDWRRLIIVSLSFSLFQLSFAILQSKGEAGKYFILRNVYALAIFLTVIMFGRKYIENWYVYFDVQALFMGIIFFIVGLNYIWRFQIKNLLGLKDELSYCVKFGAKLMPYTMSGWVVGNLDKIFLSSNQNQIEQISVLAVGQSVYAIAAFFFVAINAAWAPQFFKIMSNSNRNEVKKYRKLFFGLMVLIVLLVFICAILIENMYIKKGYNDYLLVLLILGLMKIVDGDSIFYSNYFYFNEEVYILSKIAISTSVMYIIFLYVGSKYFGLLGVLLAGLMHSLMINISYRVYAMKRNHE